MNNKINFGKFLIKRDNTGVNKLMLEIEKQIKIQNERKIKKILNVFDSIEIDIQIKIVKLLIKLININIQNDF